MEIEERQEYYKDCVFYPFKVKVGVAFRYETELYGGKVCMPSVRALQEDERLGEFKKMQAEFMAQNPLTEYLSDIMATTEVLQVGLGLAFLIGFIYMFVLRLFAGPIVFFSLFGIIGGIAYGGWMLYDYSQGIPASD